ncbi:unnamed protein product [Rotaria magnacalcarata]|uniref:Uncharacterized protein n=1 Tax=Rotaria magnacalcarata TaxID=392030 RepID=A0A8S2PJE8_9BILA|nr:unnamed protein product [Rotaria magnacalcarata]
MQYWRIAGLNYIQFSAACARTVRRCLKSSMAKDAMKREESYVRVNKWQGGKISDQVHAPSKPWAANILTLLVWQ